MQENKLIIASKFLNFSTISFESYQILLLEGNLGILVQTLKQKNEFHSEINGTVG